MMLIHIAVQCFESNLHIAANDGPEMSIWPGFLL